MCLGQDVVYGLRSSIAEWGNPYIIVYIYIYKSLIMD